MGFQRDITNITTSKEFRRMQDKTQLFYARKSDHYRTRLTHTLEVCDIALQIAENLRNKYLSGDEKTKSDYLPCKDLDDKLITAIAYGHDIGHTPFGHIGERVLSDILDGTDNLGGLIDTEKIMKQCFKHNINSFRILVKDDGDNFDEESISWETLDGVLKHTKVYKDKNAYNHLDENERSDPYQIKKAGSRGILSGGNTAFNGLKNLRVEATGQSFNYYRHNCALTLEGQIVALADEIAQRISDFDDAVRAGFWIPSKKDFISDGNEITFYQNHSKLIDDLTNIEHSEKNVTKICKLLREFLISDVDFFPEKKDMKNFGGRTVYFGKCIDFSNNNGGADANRIFDRINRDYIIKCKEIRKCDGISKHVIRQIFKAYYNDFSQLSDTCLNTLYSDLTNRARSLIKNEKNRSSDKKNNSSPNNTFLLDEVVDIDKKLVFIQSVKDACLGKDLDEICQRVKKANATLENLFRKLTENETSEQAESENETEYNVKREYRKRWLPELHSIILRNIVFYIAGMTDSYARDEYQRLYSIKMPMNTY